MYTLTRTQVNMFRSALVDLRDCQPTERELRIVARLESLLASLEAQDDQPATVRSHPLTPKTNEV